MQSVNELMSLKGRTALIAGGAGHLGSAMAEALAEAGANLAILDLSDEGCATICKKMEQKFAVNTLALPMDLTDEDAVRAAPERVTDKLGGLDILIYCAALIGVTPLKGWAVPFAQQSSETWRQALEVNLTAAFVLTQAAAPALRASGHGSIITVASHYALVGPDMSFYEGTDLGNPAAYTASKGGLVQFTRWLSTTLAPDIRANSLTPGGIWRQQPEAFHQRYVARTPLRRMATEEDYKGATLFLASDLSAYMTGQNLVVDGGITAW